MCAYDRELLLALSQEAFDQDLNGGWRALAKHQECIAVAADLIRDYREKWRLEDKVFYWHEGQLRAAIGQTGQAIVLFEKSRSPSGQSLEWTLYVDATIAFLKRNLAALKRAREGLAQLPRPSSWPPRDANDQPIDIPWPPNLQIVDRLIRCFGRDYQEAYGSPCGG